MAYTQWKFKSSQRYGRTLKSLVMCMLRLGVNKYWSVMEETTEVITRCYFNVYGSVHRKNILIYVQQDATLHSLFYLETAQHVSGGISIHHQEHKQMYLQHLVFVTPLLLPAAIAAGSSNGVKNTRCCRYSCLLSRWWVEIPPETCRAVSR
jgi:hypothetical protein